MSEKIISKYRESMSGSYATLAIIGINIVFFIAIKVIPDIINELQLQTGLDMVLKKPWTLVTVIFSHKNYVHILFNMALIFFFGKELEKITSSKIVLLIYLITGVVGSLVIIATAHFLNWNETILGASAAAFGVTATFAAMRPNVIILGSKMKLWVSALFIVNAIITILNPQISIGSGAHVMGIIVGLICGYFLKKIFY